MSKLLYKIGADLNLDKLDENTRISYRKLIVIAAYIFTFGLKYVRTGKKKDFTKDYSHIFE